MMSVCVFSPPLIVGVFFSGLVSESFLFDVVVDLAVREK